MVLHLFSPEALNDGENKNRPRGKKLGDDRMDWIKQVTRLSVL